MKNELQRSIKTPGAILMGLGSIIGTGIFVSIAIATQISGYGRIATLGEEVTEPRKTIPKAIILTMVVIVLLYLSVSLTALSVMGAEAFGQTADAEAAPLMIVAQMLSIPFIGTVISVAAITAMLGVLLNLILGLSRVLLGMARRRDVPGVLWHTIALRMRSSSDR